MGLIDKQKRMLSTDQFCAQLRNRLDSIPGIKFSMKPTQITGNNQPQIQIVVMAANMDELWAAAKRVKEIVSKTPGADYVEFSTKSLKTEVQVKLDRDKIARMVYRDFRYKTPTALLFGCPLNYVYIAHTTLLFIKK